MAGSICTMPNNGDSDWSGFVTIVEKTIRGYMGISLSNLAGSAAPQIQDGSVIEIGGSIYQFTTAETITGWPSAAGTTEYIAAVPAGSVVTVIFTTTAPTWSGTKGGWYSGNNRYIGTVEWGGSATYSNKFIYQRFNDGGGGGISADQGIRTSGIKSDPFVQTGYIPMGEWNMDATADFLITAGTLASRFGITAITQIIGIEGWVWNDVGGGLYQMDFAGEAFIFTEIIYVQRDNEGFFDDVAFDGTASTVPNRGYVEIKYIL